MGVDFYTCVVCGEVTCESHCLDATDEDGKDVGGQHCDDCYANTKEEYIHALSDICVVVARENKRPSPADVACGVLPTRVAAIIVGYYAPVVQYKLLREISTDTCTELVKWTARAASCAAMLVCGDARLRDAWYQAHSLECKEDGHNCDEAYKSVEAEHIWGTLWPDREDSRDVKDCFSFVATEEFSRMFTDLAKTCGWRCDCTEVFEMPLPKPSPLEKARDDVESLKQQLLFAEMRHEKLKRTHQETTTSFREWKCASALIGREDASESKEPKAERPDCDTDNDDDDKGRPAKRKRPDAPAAAAAASAGTEDRRTVPSVDLPEPSTALM